MLIVSLFEQKVNVTEITETWFLFYSTVRKLLCLNYSQNNRDILKKFSVAFRQQQQFRDKHSGCFANNLDN